MRGLISPYFINGDRPLIAPILGGKTNNNFSYLLAITKFTVLA
jgi:hypothetical protein